MDIKGKLAKKGIANEVMRRLDAKEPDKSQRTLYLNTLNYRQLETFADKQGRKPSHIIDELISIFLEQADK